MRNRLAIPLNSHREEDILLSYNQKGVLFRLFIKILHA